MEERCTFVRESSRKLTQTSSRWKLLSRITKSFFLTFTSQAFKNYDESGSPRRTTCLKYLGEFRLSGTLQIVNWPLALIGLLHHYPFLLSAGQHADEVWDQSLWLARGEALQKWQRDRCHDQPCHCLPGLVCVFFYLNFPPRTTTSTSLRRSSRWTGRRSWRTLS